MRCGNRPWLARVAVSALLAALLVSCARPSGFVVPTATPSLCDIGVSGRWVIDRAGKPLVLYGASLPTLSQMQASAYPAADRLRDLAAAGASVVRLPVDFYEETPTFVPEKVVPFVQQANRLGMVVVLGWSTVLSGTGSYESDPLNDAVDDTEDWLRQEITYLSNNPGVWFDLYDGTLGVSPTRQRNIATRLIDVARGYRANNVIVVNDPVWLLEKDPAVNQPLEEANVVYGLDARPGAKIGLPQAAASGSTGGSFDVTRYPFIVTHWDGNPADLPRLSQMQIGAVAALTDNPATPALSSFWKANRAGLGACH